MQYTDLAYSVLVSCELSVFDEWERHSVTFMIILSAMAMIIMINDDTISYGNDYNDDTISYGNDYND